MRKLFLAILALASVSAVLTPVRVYAQQDEGVVQAMMPDARDMTRAARLRTAQDGPPGDDPDTVWIGHIYDKTYTAGGKMIAGGYGPYRVGRGPNRPKRQIIDGLLTIGDNGTWDFDRFQPARVDGTLPASWLTAENDSLQGWWPVARAYQSGATTFGDYVRAFQGLDYGNNVNYVINQGGPKRTFGVVGLWHRDRGNTAYVAADTVEDKDPILAGVQDNITNVQPVLWSPTDVGGAGSTASAWMGMRSHGDLSVREEVANGGTGNYFNATVQDYVGNNGFNQIGSASVNGSDHEYPGYGSQMDQMLYRDITLAEGDGLNISFNFSTNMSTSKNGTAGIQIGWFDKDPISNAHSGTGSAGLPTNDGNFISATAAGANAPCDSFMVYVGAPVGSSAKHSDGVTRTVYDPKRRWFSEVVKISGTCSSGSPCGIIGKELASYAGVNAPTSVSVNVGNLYPTQLKAIKDADGNTTDGGVVRLLFRVKTNRGFDDENSGNPAASFSSATRGAAIVDNVLVTEGGWAAADGNFEAADAINNSLAATSAWRSTGKPPAAYFHAHTIARIGAGQLPFSDPCGDLDNANRQCNLYGKIVTPGDHDAAEKDGGLFDSNTQDRLRWLGSPTINLSSTGNGPGFYNGMGIDDEIARTSFDYAFFSSLYNAGFVNATTATGNFVSVGCQSYPARGQNGNICWGETRHTASIFFYGTRACFETLYSLATSSIGYKANGIVRTTNLQNRPDSMRVYISRISRCYTFAAISEPTCSPTEGDNVGTYFDNISLCLIDGGTPPEMSLPIWMLINDAFPSNGDDALIPTNFDTTAAQVRIGLNMAFQTGTVARPAISGDSVALVAPGADTRLDMVFRVDFGPGNYLTIGTRSSGVVQRPDRKPAGAVLAVSGDGSWVGTYIASPGPFSSTLKHAAPSNAGHGTQGSNWDKNVWNSARMDTIENNIYLTGNNANVWGNVAGQWASMLHEDDANFTTLGILKNVCFMQNPAGATNSTNILCDGVIPTAYVGLPGISGTTREYTKIIPDGLLTPGSHVQYFFRKSIASDLGSPGRIAPDTNFIFQDSEGNNDGHRWQQFSVLPDRWKSASWSIPDRHAAGPACMLYIDWEDRRGDERVWVGVADTIGATAAGRYGAHNGWHGDNNQDMTVDLRTVIGGPDDYGVYAHGGQPGTSWDMFGVKASESSTTSSSLGSRTIALPPGIQLGKQNRNGPSGLMLRNYYNVLLALTGDLNAGNIGPYADKGDNDVGLLQDFAYATEGTSQPRRVWFQGRGFVEGQVLGAGAGHPTFPTTYFGAGLVAPDYRSYAGNTNDIVDLVPLYAPLFFTPTPYGVLSSCVIRNDVLSLVLTTAPGALGAAKYPDTGTPVSSNPKISTVYAPNSVPGGSSAHPMMTVVDGFRIQSLGTQATLASGGTIGYYYNVLSRLFASLNCTLAAGSPVAVGENPNPALVNFLALRSENPFRDGAAKITFGITRKEKVELKVYDVTGRLVKTLANREFTVGEHSLYWDGSNDDGQLVSRGVYFYQLRTPTFVSQKKLAVLKP